MVDIRAESIQWSEIGEIPKYWTCKLANFNRLMLRGSRRARPVHHPHSLLAEIRRCTSAPFLYSHPEDRIFVPGVVAARLVAARRRAVAARRRAAARARARARRAAAFFAWPRGAAFGGALTWPGGVAGAACLAAFFAWPGGTLAAFAAFVDCPGAAFAGAPVGAAFAAFFACPGGAGFATCVAAFFAWPGGTLSGCLPMAGHAKSAQAIAALSRTAARRDGGRCRTTVTNFLIGKRLIRRW